MRAQYLLFATSFAVLTCGIAVAHQDQDKPAEQVFRNIQSFKGQPASTILPAMQFMCASLKVECDYCHVQDRSSDEKEEKQTARKMIAMQKEINDNNFGGRTQVTCATCHAGHTHPVNLPPIQGTDLRPRRAEGVDAAKVLADYDAALGAGASVQSVELDGQTVREGKAMPFATTQSGEKVVVTEGDIKAGYNGSTGWYKSPQGAETLPPEVIDGFFRADYTFASSGSLPKLDNPRVGTAQIDGKDVVILTGQITGSKNRASLCFDKKSGLLTRVEWLQPTILGYIPETADYSDYHRVSGVEVPMKVAIHMVGADEVRTVKSAHINGNVDSNVFEQPKS